MGVQGRVLAQNRRARFEYEILKTYEVGIELKGTEVKSIREGKINLSESYCRVTGTNGRLVDAVPYISV
jgi:SsrA-binding protein